MQDREDEARYGAAAVSGRAGFMGPGGPAPYAGAPGGGRGGFGGGFGGRGGYGGAAMGGPVAGSGRHLYITGVSRSSPMFTLAPLPP